MDAQRFTALVREAAGVDDDGARRAIAATLTTLAERLSEGEARNLAEQLPPEIAPWLGKKGGPERFDVDECLRRVSEREGVDAATAERHARAVFIALGHAVGADEIAHVAAQLPEDFATVLPRGPEIESLSGAEFVGRVARRAGVDADRARRATDAVLETLAERIARGEVEDLVARLPVELHPSLRRGEAASGGAARPVPLDRFLRRVAERDGATAVEALVHARAVLATLREAVGDREFFDVTDQLPVDYKQTLAPGAGSG